MVTFDNGRKANDTVYSDRLFQWDHKKHDELCMKHFGNSGQYWDKREPENIEAFLRDYMNDQTLILCKTTIYEYMARDYLIWRFDYLTSPQPSVE
jgi:hypothetical protein